MAHGKQGVISTSQQPHRKLFKKIGKRLIQCVKSQQSELLKPYCNVEINEVTVLTVLLFSILLMCSKNMPTVEKNSRMQKSVHS